MIHPIIAISVRRLMLKGISIDARSNAYLALPTQKIRNAMGRRSSAKIAIEGSMVRDVLGIILGIDLRLL